MHLHLLLCYFYCSLRHCLPLCIHFKSTFPTLISFLSYLACLFHFYHISFLEFMCNFILSFKTTELSFVIRILLWILLILRGIFTSFTAIQMRTLYFPYQNEEINICAVNKVICRIGSTRWNKHACCSFWVSFCYSLLNFKGQSVVPETD